MSLNSFQILDSVTQTSREDVYVKSVERVSTNSSSKGNQLKWKSGNKFIKLNYLGYEDKAEVLVSNLLSYINIGDNSYVKYYLCNVYEDGVYLGEGCFSYSFLEEDWSEIKVCKILERNMYPLDSSYEDIVELCEQITGLNVRHYIDTVLCLDALTLNEDRHLNNLSFQFNGTEWRYTPIYDNGLAFLADLKDYPMHKPIHLCIRQVKSKPFKSSFSEQLKLIDKNNILKLNSAKLCNFAALSEFEKRALSILKYTLEKYEGLAWEEVLYE